MSNPEKFDGPLLLLNASVNLAEGDELAWQERKAGSFCLSPLFCGYAQRRDEDVAREAEFYRPTSFYADKLGLSLGQAMALSAAALSPNKGYRTTRPMAALMTVLNLRLGLWLPNPSDNSHSSSRKPLRNRFKYLLFELLGHTNDKSPFVYVSDGGHFENLGIYELVRRRCRLIIACDASEDSGRTFRSMGNAIERCRVDFGVEIALDVSALSPEGTRYAKKGWMWGRVRYTKDAVDDGLILYIKAVLTRREQSILRVTLPSTMVFHMNPRRTSGSQSLNSNAIDASGSI